MGILRKIFGRFAKRGEEPSPDRDPQPAPSPVSQPGPEERGVVEETVAMKETDTRDDMEAVQEPEGKENDMNTLFDDEIINDNSIEKDSSVGNDKTGDGIMENGVDDKKGKTLTLTAPARKTYSSILEKALYWKKDRLWNEIQGIVKYLQLCDRVEWEGEPAFAGKAEYATEQVLKHKASALKEQMVTFYTCFYGNPENINKYVDYAITPKGMEIASLIVEKGAVPLSEICGIMGWPEPKIARISSTVDSGTMKRWLESEDTGLLAVMTRIFNGPDPETSRLSHYPDKIPFVIPESDLISFYLRRIGTAPVELPADIGKTETVTTFSGMDLFGNEDMLKVLIVTGTVSPGKTKIGQPTLRKLSGLLTLRTFGGNVRTLLPRIEYVATAAFRVFGNFPDFRVTSKSIDDETFLRRMYENTVSSRTFDFYNIISGGLKTIPTAFHYHKLDDLAMVSTSMQDVLVQVHKEHKGKWMEYGSFIHSVELLAAGKGTGHIIPKGYEEHPDVFRDINNQWVLLGDFKTLIHDKVMRAFTEGLAAIGAVDLMFGESGDIIGVRPTEGFLWYKGMKRSVPRPTLEKEQAHTIEIDDSTGMIVVASDKYPYMNILPEFAEKMTDSRYRITTQSMLRNCTTPDQLEMKIKRLKTFIMPKIGEGINRILEGLRAACDLVRKTPGGSVYTLLDIDRKDTRLHKLIVEDEEIRKHSLRVEGCRLLVKTKFVPRFREILARNGYLTGDF